MPETDDEVAELARTLDQMLRELDAARAETQQMIQAQRDFVADASHELRTPLTSILANLELLEASLAARGADPDEEEIVAGALGSSRRMRRLVADLLLLARADAGRAGPAPQLRPGRDRRRGDRRGAAGRRRPRARARRRPRRSRSRATPTTFTGWSLNLVENGVRHTPAGHRRSRSRSSRRDGEARARGRRRRPRAPRRASASRSSPASCAATAPPTSPATPAPASAWRSSRRSPASHGGRVEVGALAAGGARFTVRLPLGRAGSATRSPRFFSAALQPAHTFAPGRDTARRGHPRQCLAGHHIGQF